MPKKKSEPVEQPAKEAENILDKAVDEKKIVPEIVKSRVAKLIAEGEITNPEEENLTPDKEAENLLDKAVEEAATEDEEKVEISEPTATEEPIVVKNVESEFVEINPENFPEGLPRQIFNDYQRNNQISFKAGGNSPAWFSPLDKLVYSPRSGDIVNFRYDGRKVMYSSYTVVKASVLQKNGEDVSPIVYKLELELLAANVIRPADEEFVNKGFYYWIEKYNENKKKEEKVVDNDITNNE